MAFINPENKTQVIVIIVAVAAGVIASALVGGYVSSKVNEETTKLSVQYEKVQQEKEKQYSEQIASMGQKLAVVEQNARKAAEETARLVASKMSQPAQPATPVVKKKPSLALRTPPGKRAVTVMLDSLGAVGGLVNPGDFVDVIAHLNIPTGKKTAKEAVTAMVFQNLQILAINTNLDEPGAYEFQQKEQKLRVTFAVDPREAGLLSFAEMNGNLELALRAPNEKDHQMLPTATWTSLAEYVLENNGADIQSNESGKAVVDEAPKMEQRAEDAQPYIEIYRGGREL
jgi:Flp pilus assembly protein CpaB